MLTTELHLRHLMTSLLYYPTPAVIDEIIDQIMGIASEMGDTARITWHPIKQSILNVVGSDWDTAVLIASKLDSRISVAAELRHATKALNLYILSNPDEQNLTARLFGNSPLKAMLVNGGSDAEIVNARKVFLLNLINAITTILWFTRRRDLYNIARAKAHITPGSWLPYKGEDDYFSNAYTHIFEEFSSIWPSNYTALLVNIMRTEIINSLNFYNRVELSAS